MDTPYSDSEHPFSNEEMRLAELLHQFLALSDDQDFAGRITFRGPNGEFIGEAKLSARDIETVTDALTSVNAYRQQAEDEQLTGSADLPPVDADDVTDVVDGFESLLANEAHDNGPTSGDDLIDVTDLKAFVRDFYLGTDDNEDGQS